MRRRLLLAAFVLAMAGPSVQAAEPKAQVGQYVDIQPVGLPVVWHGQLVNYVFVDVRLNLAGSADATRLREKEPYFRDALVRAAHRTPFTVPNDPNRIDEDRLKAAMAREGALIAGPGQIQSVVVSSQTPQKRVYLPKS